MKIYFILLVFTCFGCSVCKSKINKDRDTCLTLLMNEQYVCKVKIINLNKTLVAHYNKPRIKNKKKSFKISYFDTLYEYQIKIDSVILNRDKTVFTLSELRGIEKLKSTEILNKNRDSILILSNSTCEMLSLSRVLRVSLPFCPCYEGYFIGFPQINKDFEREINIRYDTIKNIR